MQTKRWVQAVILVLALSPVTTAFAQHEGHEHGKEEAKPNVQDKGQAIDLQGEVLDMACYMKHEGKGPKHKSCAQTCLNDGAPVGILTAEGSVYFLVEDHDVKKPFALLKSKAAEQVKVTGTLYERGGTRAVVVKSVDVVK